MVDDLAQAVATQTFVAHTAAGLSDEEMEVIIHPSHFVLVWAYLPPSSHSLSGARSITGLNPPRGTPAEDFGRRRGIRTSKKRHTNSMAPFLGLAQQLLAILATLAHAIRLAIPTLVSYIGTFSLLISWPFPCNHLKELPPSSFHTISMALSPPSLEELPANGLHGKPSTTPTPRTPHHLLSERGGTRSHHGHPTAWT